MRLLLLSFITLLAVLSHAAAPLETPLQMSILPNGGFEKTTPGGAWPLHWELENATYESEDNNRFLRLRSKDPAEMTKFFYLKINVPKNFEKFEFKCRARCENIEHGPEVWNDARIIFNFLDKTGAKTEAPSLRFSGTSDWRAVTHKFAIPPNAVALEIIPCHFHSASGLLDLDDLWLAPTDPVKPPPVPLGKNAALVVVGNRLYTLSGNETWLQGVNIPSLEWWHEGDHLRESLAAALEDWNVNVIRLAVKERFWFGRDPKQGENGAEAYRKLVDESIETAAQRGCYTVLDLHEYRAPTPAHAEFWKDAAARYANHPAVLFDMINEPYGVSWKVWRDGGALDNEHDDAAPAESKEGKELEHTIGMQKLLDTIRGTGAKNIVIAGGLDWAYDLSGVASGITLKETGGNGVVYAAHMYPWKKDWADKVLAAAKKHPVFIGEIGCWDKPMDFEATLVDPYQWAPDALSFIQKNRLHWAAWSFHTGAAPCVISDWKFTPTPYWGAFVRAALRGVRFEGNRTW